MRPGKEEQMKKLFALILALGLLCSLAWAEDAPPELNWNDLDTEKLLANGGFQFISIQDPELTLIYWIPSNLAPLDVSTIESETPPDAAFESEDQKYSVSVFARRVKSLEDYLTALGVKDKAHLLMVNGLQVISAEVPDDDLDLAVVPVDSTTLITFVFSPLNEDGWDEVKASIVASIQLPQ
jgi:hypothetical protein